MSESIEASEPRPVSGLVEFLAEFRNPQRVLTEEILTRSYAGRQTPYRWLARAVSSGARVVLDVACGTGPMSRELAASGRTVVGLDISRPALLQAASRSAGPWLQADATRLPFADESLDAVTTAMGLVAIEPVTEFLAEVARVLKPGGVFASITPTGRPLRGADLAVLARLTRLLRTTPWLPTSFELVTRRLLSDSGLSRAEDRRERYAYQPLTAADAERLIAAGYPGAIDAELRQAAVDYLVGRTTGQPVTVPIPVRRIVAVK